MDFSKDKQFFFADLRKWMYCHTDFSFVTNAGI